MEDYVLTTERLGLRGWADEDVAPMAALCADPEVMRYFPAVQTRGEVAAFVARQRAHEAEHEICFWAVDELATGAFAGCTGLWRQADPGYPFAPGIEIGWRFRKTVWRRGYATEAARACLRYARDELAAAEVHAVTPEPNAPSRGVMAKLGMGLRGRFDHPRVAEASGLRRHVWYAVGL